MRAFVFIFLTAWLPLEGSQLAERMRDCPLLVMTVERMREYLLRATSFAGIARLNRVKTRRLCETHRFTVGKTFCEYGRFSAAQGSRPQ
jgi:hypothetical protein